MIYITNNRHSETQDFELYDTQRLVEYAAANHIGLYVVSIDEDGAEPSEEMKELADGSDGLALPYDDPAGIKKNCREYQTEKDRVLFIEIHLCLRR